MKKQFLLILLILFILIGCGKKSSEKKSVERVISLAPNITEMIYYIGAERKLIANTRFCDYPDAAKKLPKVADLNSINIEKIVALDPDLVIASYSGNPRDQVERLNLLGIDVILLKEHKVEDIITNIGILGEVFQIDTKSQQEELNRVLSELTYPGRGLTAMVILNLYPIFSASTQTIIGDIVEKLGFENAVESSVAYPIIDNEKLLALNPDVFLITSELTNYIDSIYQMIAELKLKTRVLIVDADRFSRPGPRVFDFLREFKLNGHELRVRNLE